MRLTVVALAAGAGLLGVGALQRLAPTALKARAPWVVAAVTASAALAALAAPGAPTGMGPVDGFLRAVLAALVTWAASRCRRGPLLVAAGIAAIGSSGGSTPPAFAALGATVGAAVFNVRSRTLGAVVGAGLSQALLRLGWPHVHGVTAALAALAVALLATSAVRCLRRRERRQVFRLSGAVVGAGGLVSVLFGFAALEARPSLERGLDAARAGIAASRDGKGAQVAERFSEASRLFEVASGRLGSWWAQPARLVPVLGQHARAAHMLSDAGQALAASGAQLAKQVNADRVSLVDGRVDVAAVGAFAGPLEDGQRALLRARAQLAGARSPWLAPPVTSLLDDLDQRMARATISAEQASLAARWAPQVLGADRPRRYLLAVHTPSEERGSGGVIGNYGILTAERGKLALPLVARIGALNDGRYASGRELHGSPEFVSRYGRTFNLTTFIQNSLASPDFPSSAATLADLYRQSGGEPVDGVVAIDPLGLAALLQLTGPVTVSSWPEDIGPANAGSVLLYEHYVRFANDQEKRIEFLNEVARATFHKLTAGPLPGPAAVASALSPALRGRHIQLWSPEPDVERLFKVIGADGGLRPVRRDAFGLVTQNATASKIEYFLRREVSYDANFDPKSGMVEANAQVTLHNDAPASGLPPYVIGFGQLAPPGHMALYLSVYSALQLVDATLDGQPLTLAPEQELGHRVYSAIVTVPPQGQRKLNLRLAGPILGDSYRLDLHRQPTVAPDAMDVHLREAGGTSQEQTWSMNQDTTITLPSP